METAPTNTAQPAPSATPLTIDTQRLRDLWLPVEKEEREAVDYMNKLCRDKYADKNLRHLNRACCEMVAVHRATVRAITERGGLLLIGGAA